MIKIGKIYQSLFVPYCESFSENLQLAYHDPFGRTDVASIKMHIKGSDEVPANCVYIQDQEPVNLKLQQDTFANIHSRVTKSNIKSRVKKSRFAMITSEYNSIDVAQLRSHICNSFRIHVQAHTNDLTYILNMTSEESLSSVARASLCRCEAMLERTPSHASPSSCAASAGVTSSANQRDL